MDHSKLDPFLMIALEENTDPDHKFLVTVRSDVKIANTDIVYNGEFTAKQIENLSQDPHVVKITLSQKLNLH